MCSRKEPLTWHSKRKIVRVTATTAATTTTTATTAPQPTDALVRVKGPGPRPDLLGSRKLVPYFFNLKGLLRFDC